VPHGCKGVDDRYSRWPSRDAGKAGAGRSKGRRGAKVPVGRKALRIVLPARIVHAGARVTVLAASVVEHARASGMPTVEEATGVSEARSRTHREGKTTPTRGESDTDDVRPAEAIGLT
jgi:hypothetical protein